MFSLRSGFSIFTRSHKPAIKLNFIYKIITHRKFQTSLVVCDVPFQSYENAFAHNVLERNNKYKVLRGEQNVESNIKCETIDLNQKWSNLSLDDILLNFRMIGSYCKNPGLSIADERFDAFVDAFTERCFDFTDNELIKSLQILMHHPQTTSPNTRNFVELWNALDDACIERLDRWDYNKILYVCDHWYMLNLGRVNKFNQIGNLRIGKKLRKLPPHQMVQTMFYLNIKRSPILEMFDYEVNLMGSIDQLNLEEIAVMCMGFFKTKTRIKSEDLVAKIFQRLIKEINTVQDLPFTCIIKILRYSSNFTHVEFIQRLYRAADDQIQRLSAMSCLHLAVLGTHSQICHQKCIEKIIDRFNSDIKSLRLKDLERIAFVLGLYDFESESRVEEKFCQNILNELKNRVDDIVEHPKCLPLCLHYLTMKGYYDEEIINVVLSKPFLELCYGTNINFGREIFSLDSYAQINLKGTYEGNLLPDKNRQCMGKMLSQFIPDRSGKWKITATDKILLELKETSEELFKHSYIAHVLPHFDRPDVIVAYDKSSKSAIDIALNFPELYSGKIIDRTMLLEGLKINQTNVEIINFIVGGWNNYVRDTQKLNGQLKQKVEQSKIIGFRPMLIPWFDWTRLNADERQAYITYKLQRK